MRLFFLIICCLIGCVVQITADGCSHSGPIHSGPIQTGPIPVGSLQLGPIQSVATHPTPTGLLGFIQKILNALKTMFKCIGKFLGNIRFSFQRNAITCGHNIGPRKSSPIQLGIRVKLITKLKMMYTKIRKFLKDYIISLQKTCAHNIGPIQSAPIQSNNEELSHIELDLLSSGPIQSVPIQSVPIQSVPTQSVPIQSVPIRSPFLHKIFIKLKGMFTRIITFLKESRSSLQRNAKTCTYHAGPRPSGPRPSGPIQIAPIQSAPIQSAPIQLAPIQLAPIQAVPIHSPLTGLRDFLKKIFINLKGMFTRIRTFLQNNMKSLQRNANTCTYNIGESNRMFDENTTTTFDALMSQKTESPQRDATTQIFSENPSTLFDALKITSSSEKDTTTRIFGETTHSLESRSQKTASLGEDATAMGENSSIVDALMSQKMASSSDTSIRMFGGNTNTFDPLMRQKKATPAEKDASLRMFSESTDTFDSQKSLKMASTDEDATKRILGGDDAELGEFPFQALVIGHGPFNNGQCGGSLITPFWILTAGHCVADYQYWDIRLGIIRVDEYPSVGYSDTTKKGITYPHMNIRTLENDIGLIGLTRRAPMTPYIQTVRLPSHSEASRSIANLDVVVSGWGQLTDDTNSLSRTLQYVQLKTISNRECDRYRPPMFNMFVTTLCTIGNPDRGHCYGDSGGPLVKVGNDGIWTQIGIVSAGPQQCSAGPSTYTRVDCFIDWIAEITGIPVRP